MTAPSFPSALPVCFLLSSPARALAWAAAVPTRTVPLRVEKAAAWGGVGPGAATGRVSLVARRPAGRLPRCVLADRPRREAESLQRCLGHDGRTVPEARGEGGGSTTAERGGAGAGQSEERAATAPSRDLRSRGHREGFGARGCRPGDDGNAAPAVRGECGGKGGGDGMGPGLQRGER